MKKILIISILTLGLGFGFCAESVFAGGGQGGQEGTDKNGAGERRSGGGAEGTFQGGGSGQKISRSTGGTINLQDFRVHGSSSGTGPSWN